MTDVTIGGPAPDFTLSRNGEGTVTLSKLQGKAVILYFYPKDDTPGCTREAQDFSAHMSEFKALDAAVLGVSQDAPAKHQKFVGKYDLTVPLATDTDSSVMEAFGVWVQKSMYGKTYMGIERSTFLFAADGTLARAWRKVRVPGHVAEVLEAVRAL